MGVKWATIIHPAKFRDLRPPHRPDISVISINVILWASAPFVFMDNDDVKKNVFFFRVCRMYMCLIIDPPPHHAGAPLQYSLNFKKIGHDDAEYKNSFFCC
jgi:hypothetical protein